MLCGSTIGRLLPVRPKVITPKFWDFDIINFLKSSHPGTFKKVYVSDITKAGQLLGWQPKHEAYSSACGIVLMFLGNVAAHSG